MSYDPKVERELILTGMDPILAYMQNTGIPVTRQAYLDVAGLVEPLTAEEENGLPPGIRQPGN
jgi:hypothetical protein